MKDEAYQQNNWKKKKVKDLTNGNYQRNFEN